MSGRLATPKRGFLRRRRKDTEARRASSSAQLSPAAEGTGDVRVRTMATDVRVLLNKARAGDPP